METKPNIEDLKTTLSEILNWGKGNGDFKAHAKRAFNRNFGMTIQEAANKSYPDGGGKYLINGVYMEVHCDEYHMHRFKCLSKVKSKISNAIVRSIKKVGG